MTLTSSLGYSNTVESLRMGPSQLVSTSVFIRRDVKESRDEAMSRRRSALMSSGHWQIPPAQPQERTISMMRQTCHLSQSYYTKRKQAHLSYFQFKCINIWDRKCTIRVFQAKGKHSTHGATKMKAKTRQRQESLFWTGCVFQTDFIKCNRQLLFFFFLHVFLCKTKVDMDWGKTENCLFPLFKAKNTLYPQLKSFLPLLTLGFSPLWGKQIDGWSHCTRGFRSVPAIHPWVSQKQEKKTLNLFVNVPREPLPGTSRHKVGVMASHRLYTELFWRFTQWTSATTSVRTCTLPLCDVELTLMEAFATL